MPAMGVAGRLCMPEGCNCQNCGCACCHDTGAGVPAREGREAPAARECTTGAPAHHLATSGGVAQAAGDGGVTPELQAPARRSNPCLPAPLAWHTGIRMPRARATRCGRSTAPEACLLLLSSRHRRAVRGARQLARSWPGAAHSRCGAPPGQCRQLPGIPCACSTVAGASPDRHGQAQSQSDASGAGYRPG